MDNWFKKQYNDIKGNMKWALLAALWWVIVNVGKRMLQLIPNIPAWLVWAILLCLSLAVFAWLAKSSKMAAAGTSLQSTQQRPPSFPSVSALQGQIPQITFDAHEWFRLAYHSPVTAEVENNFKVVAQRTQPNDREGFYARFIGVGLVAYLHDMTWSTIFKSQLLMLAELNRRNGHLPLLSAKRYYDEAVKTYPRIYANYSFEQWLNYMKNEQLLLQHPSDMLEITHRGKDLLRYLAHWGRDANVKKD